ncbi:hypothetical protein NB694_002021 [Pantoea ananatis]|nr:hypothetical protein [Pantoea ananatis]MDC7859875.1 hypothetical protein [Pantoea ananatis]
MSRQDVGESRAAPGMARPGGPAEILKQRRDRAAAGGQDGSPGSRGRGGWRPLVGRPQGQTETPCRLASETFPESLTESLAKRPTAGTNRYLLRANS